MKFTLASLVLMSLGHMLQAEDNGYEAREFKHNGLTQPYRWLEPTQIQEGVKYPLVIFLHGAGERGTDNAAQLKHCCSKFLEPEVREKFPCFVLVPQCPDGKRWVEVDWGQDQHTLPESPSEPLTALLAHLDFLQPARPIDPQRIYIIGLSMGGFGTWDLISRHPSRFAAAVPICGGADEAQAVKLTKVPIWAFHGDQDTVVKPDRSRRMIEAIKTAGGQPNYTEYTGVGHDSWNPAIREPDLLTWLFAQRLESNQRP